MYFLPNLFRALSFSPAESAIFESNFPQLGIVSIFLIFFTFKCVFANLISCLLSLEFLKIRFVKFGYVISMIKLDILISHSLDLKPDEERIARADGKEDARRD